MPARSVAFANLRGGCGKSTILFQLASEFAKAHASTGVLVVDCTAFGDVSRLLLGGRQPHVKKAVAEQHADGRSTAHLLSTLLGPEAPPAVPTTLGRAGIAPMSGGAPRAVASWAASTLEMNVAKRFGVPVSEVNPGIPMPNLLLIPSGATKRQPCSGTGRLDILRLARNLRSRLDALPGDWQVFLDTDGDLTFSPATEVALRTANLCYIPYQPTESDHDRATEAVSRLQRLQPPAAKVGGIVYNMVAPEPRSTGEGWGPYSASFRPHEVAVRRMVDDFSADWWARAQSTPGSFAATPSAEVEGGQDGFVQGSVVLMQDFGKPGNLAAELGIPFCSMEAGKRYSSGGGHTETLGASKKLAAVEANVRELRLLVEEAQASLGSTSGATAALDSQIEAVTSQQLAEEAASLKQTQQLAQQQVQQRREQQPVLAVEGSSSHEQQCDQGAAVGSSGSSAAAMALAAAALVAVAPAAAPAAALAAAVIAGKQWLSK